MQDREAMQSEIVIVYIECQAHLETRIENAKPAASEVEASPELDLDITTTTACTLRAPLKTYNLLIPPCWLRGICSQYAVQPGSS